MLAQVLRHHHLRPSYLEAVTLGVFAFIAASDAMSSPTLHPAAASSHVATRPKLGVHPAAASSHGERPRTPSILRGSAADARWQHNAQLQLETREPKQSCTAIDCPSQTWLTAAGKNKYEEGRLIIADSRDVECPKWWENQIGQTTCAVSALGALSRSTPTIPNNAMKAMAWFEVNVNSTVVRGPQLRHALPTIKVALSQRQDVVVYCGDGYYRSPVLAAAILAAVYGHDPEDFIVSCQEDSGE